MSSLQGKKILVVGNVDQRIIDKLTDEGAFVTKESANFHYGKIHGLSFDQVWMDEASGNDWTDYGDALLRSPRPNGNRMGENRVHLSKAGKIRV